MIIWRYPYDKYDLSTLEMMFIEFCARAGLSYDEVIALPDDITLEKADRNTLIEIRRHIDERIQKMFYEPKCQWKGAKLPCEDPKMCFTCEHYYSDDDARWN